MSFDHEIRVLLAEDNEDCRDLVKHILKTEGFCVEVARDGTEAVAMATAGDYDVVLMDVEMPVKNGIEAMKELKQRDYKKPVIALTAHVNPNTWIPSFGSAGFSHYLSKPFDFKKLCKLIREASS